MRLMRAHMDLILFAQISCVCAIYPYQHTAASLLRSPCRVLRRWLAIFLQHQSGCKSKGYKLYEPELATRAYTHIFCLLARKRLRRRNNLGCPSQSCESTDAFHASTHGSHSVRTNIVCIYNISVSTYCCFAVVLSVPRAALAGHIFTATKRLQKQGLKTIGTKPCNASIHTYIQPAHMDLILLAQTC